MEPVINTTVFQHIICSIVHELTFQYALNDYIFSLPEIIMVLCTCKPHPLSRWSQYVGIIFFSISEYFLPYFL